MSLVSLAFVFVGPLNTLGTILTIPFMFTYAAVDYAYFSLAVSEESRKRRDTRLAAERRRGAACDASGKEVGRKVDHDGGCFHGAATVEEESTTVFDDVNDDDGDLDRLFPVDRKRRRRPEAADERRKDRAYGTGQTNRGSYQLIDGRPQQPDEETDRSGRRDVLRGTISLSTTPCHARSVALIERSMRVSERLYLGLDSGHSSVGCWP